MENAILTIKDATCLLEVLDKDISYYEKPRVALLLLVLAANPSMAENHDIISYKRNRYSDDYYSEYY